MSCVVYKGDETAIIPPEHLTDHLAQGWSVQDPKAPKVKKPKPQPKAQTDVSEPENKG